MVEPTLVEPTLSAMGACLDLARYRGIADRVGSHHGSPQPPQPGHLFVPGHPYLETPRRRL